MTWLWNSDHLSSCQIGSSEFVLRRGENLLRIVTVFLFLFCGTGLHSSAFAQTSGEEESEEPRVLEGDGLWSKKRFTVKDDGMCRQTWTCGPADIIHMKADEAVQFTPSETTDGTCKSKGGVPCRSCTAPEPATHCRWTIVPSQQGGQ